MSPLNAQAWISEKDSDAAYKAIGACRGKSAHSRGYAYQHFHQYYEHLLQSIPGGSTLGYQFLILQEGISAMQNAFASPTGQGKLHGWNSSTFGLGASSRMPDEAIAKIRLEFEREMTKVVANIVAEEIGQIDDSDRGLKISALLDAPTSTKPQTAELSSINQVDRIHRGLGTRENLLDLKKGRAGRWAKKPATLTPEAFSETSLTQSTKRIDDSSANLDYDANDTHNQLSQEGLYGGPQRTADQPEGRSSFDDHDAATSWNRKRFESRLPNRKQRDIGEY